MSKDYVKVKVQVSDYQKEKIKKSIQDGKPVSIRLDYKDYFNGEDIIALTNPQYIKLTEAYANRKGITIRMSAKQLEHNIKFSGGFLGALAGMAARFLPTIAKTLLPALGVGALSGLASAGVQKAMGSGLHLKRGGCLCELKLMGSDLTLKNVSNKAPFDHVGDGLYLKTGSSVSPVGKGLLFGANSPFNSIPIIGAIL